MIWGKTYEEKHKSSKWRIDNKHKWFAWRPVQLRDGRWIWWNCVYREWRRGFGCSLWSYTL